MKFNFAVIFLLLFSSIIGAQNKADPINAPLLTRDQALARLDDLRATAAALERVAIAPSQEDLNAAGRLGVNAVRILPREKYDNNFTAIRGGGCFYSFYFRSHEFGYGVDLMFEQGRLSTSSDFGLIGDLGQAAIDQISLDQPLVSTLASYGKTSYNDYHNDSETARLGSARQLRLNDQAYVSGVKPAIGNSYIVRTKNGDYYDVLVAFQVLRQDVDGSIILLWKLLQQYDSPEGYHARNNKHETDANILERTKSWAKWDIFSRIRVHVEDGVCVLEGAVNGKNIAYAVQLANSYGARKVVNQMTVEQ